jgi:hypothetical protein
MIVFAASNLGTEKGPAMTKTSITGDRRQDARLIREEYRIQDAEEMGLLLERRTLPATTDLLLQAQQTGDELGRDLVTLDALKDTPPRGWSRTFVVRAIRETEDRLDQGLRRLISLRRTMRAAGRAVA